MMASLRWRARALPFSSPPVGLIDVHSAARARARAAAVAHVLARHNTPRLRMPGHPRLVLRGASDRTFL